MPDAPGFGRRIDGPTGRRRAVRERTSLPVSLHSVDQSRVALLADVSESGCRIRGMGLPDTGRDLLLKVAGVELFGRIVWKADGERGVQFDQHISEAELKALRQALSGQPGQEKDVIPPEGRRKPRSD